MTPELLVRRFSTFADPVRAAWFRGPREAVILPVLEALGLRLEGLTVAEIGSGEPLLLAKALAARGARVTAVDPALAQPAVDPGPVQVVAADVLEVAPRPAGLSLSTLFFGAPLRQRARRRLREAYVAGRRPSEAEVAEVHATLETEVIARLAGWTRAGGWSVHLSLEALFACPPETWRAHGFEVVFCPGDASRVPETPSWAVQALSGLLVARRAPDHDGASPDRAECLSVT